MSIKDLLVVRIIASIPIKIWTASGAALLICFVIYCFYGSLIALALLASTILFVLYQVQDNLLYHPEIPQHSRIYVPMPSMYKMPFETVHIRSSDNVILHAFWIRHPGQSGMLVPTIVYFHGNAGNMGHRLQNVLGLYFTCRCNILLVDYRGYGLSTGMPNERGLSADSRATFDYLLTRHDIDLNQICLFGRSLGGAVAIDLAADPEYSQRIMCVILENTFTNIPEMAAELIHPALKYLPLFFYKNKYLSDYKIHFFSIPCLFVSGLADTLVPPRMMSHLYSKCGSLRKEMLQIAGGTHNDTWTGAGYYNGLIKFLSECKEHRGPLQKPPTRSKEEWPKIEEV